MAQKDIGNKVPLDTLTSTRQVEAFYDEWADGGKYNRDMQDWNYTGPEECVGVLSNYLQDTHSVILDVACGSGLVGEALQRRGYDCIYGADLSEKLLDAVPRGIYRQLLQADLNCPVDMPDNFFDAVVCVGAFTFGHLKAEVFEEFVRITKDKGYICFTINNGIYVDQGFEAELKRLERQNKWCKKELFLGEYLASKSVHARFGLFQVSKS